MKSQPKNEVIICGICLLLTQLHSRKLSGSVIDLAFSSLVSCVLGFVDMT